MISWQQKLFICEKLRTFQNLLLYKEFFTCNIKNIHYNLNIDFMNMVSYIGFNHSTYVNISLTYFVRKNKILMIWKNTNG